MTARYCFQSWHVFFFKTDTKICTNYVLLIWKYRIVKYTYSVISMSNLSEMQVQAGIVKISHKLEVL